MTDIVACKASLVAQSVKSLPAVWETWVQSLSQKDPLEKEMTTHFSILGLENPVDRGAWQDTKDLDMSERLSIGTQWLGAKTIDRVNERLQEPKSIHIKSKKHTDGLALFVCLF